MSVRTATILLLLGLLAMPGPPVTARRAVPEKEAWRWKTLATCHFDLYYPDGLEDLALKAGELAESGYLRVSGILGHEMKRIIPLVLYPAGNFSHCVKKENQADAVQGSLCNEYIPAGYVSFNGSYADLRRSITIETARVFQRAIAGETPLYAPAITSMRTPCWLSEGIARYCANGFDRSAYRSIHSMIAGNRYRGLSDNSLMQGGGDDEWASMGQAFCYFIEKRFDKETLGELLRDIRDLGFFTEALHGATGKTVEDLDRDFAGFLLELHRHESKKQLKKEVGLNRINSSRGPGDGMIPASSSDGKDIPAVGSAGGHPCIIVPDAVTGRTAQMIQLPFDQIRHPYISPDGRNIVFSAVAGSSEDIYLMDLHTKNITRITDDDFSDRYPSLSRDGGTILFLSNYNTRGDSADPDYRINQINIKTGNRTVLHPAQGNLPIIDGLAGSAIQYLSAQKSGPYPPEYHDPRINPAEITFDQYKPVTQSPWLQLGMAGTLQNSYLLFFQGVFTDILGRHRLVVSANYLRDRSSNYANASLSYTYSIRGLFLDIGFFRRGDPLRIESLNDMVDYPSTISSGIRGMEHYGGIASLGFGLGKSFTLRLGTSAGRYEKEHHFPLTRHNLKMTFGRLFMAAQYDTTEYASMVPIKGFRGQIRADHTFDLTGNRSFTGIGIDLSGYVPIGRKFIFALRGSGSMLIGPNRGNFQYYLGGFSSLRGYGLNSIAGSNMFMCSAELRFTPSDWRTFGIPRLGGLGNIGAAMFIDAGSAWNGGYRLIDKKTGRLDDLKLDFGFGVRAALSPLLILKLDFAWPFDNKTIKENVILFSIGFDYF
ncbi:MAG: BamA/TamA family outer membrane protein [Spirochaetes bacterium]|nr:BamA/TamA family outer membrane protein [Spirochaetota bacterium]